MSQIRILVQKPVISREEILKPPILVSSYRDI